MSFVIETSSRRLAPLITSCWCNTTVVSTLTRLSFLVSLDRFKSYRICLWSFIYPRVIRMSSSKDIDRQIDLPSTSIFPLFSFFFFVTLPYIFYIYIYVTSSNLLCNLNHNRQVFISIFEHGTEQIIIVNRYIDIYVYFLLTLSLTHMHAL